MTTTRGFAAHWAESWPDLITVGSAADLIGFDLFAGDDPDAVLVRGWEDPAEHQTYTLDELADNDAEDHTTPLEDGLATGGHDVPPVVVVDPHEGLRDGNHRVALATEAGLDRVPVYAPAEYWAAQ